MRLTKHSKPFWRPANVAPLGIISDYLRNIIQRSCRRRCSTATPCVHGVHRRLFTGLESALTRPLFSKLLYGLQIIYPVTCRSAPALRFWPQLGSLTCRTDTDIEHMRVAHSSRIDRRAALGAECLGALGAALGSFHINFWLPAYAKSFPRCGNARAKSGTR